MHSRSLANDSSKLLVADGARILVQQRNKWKECRRDKVAVQKSVSTTTSSRTPTPPSCAHQLLVIEPIEVGDTSPGVCPAA